MKDPFFFTSGHPFKIKDQAKHETSFEAVAV